MQSVLTPVLRLNCLNGNRLKIPLKGVAQRMVWTRSSENPGTVSMCLFSNIDDEFKVTSLRDVLNAWKEIGTCCVAAIAQNESSTEQFILILLPNRGSGKSLQCQYYLVPFEEPLIGYLKEENLLDVAGATELLNVITNTNERDNITHHQVRLFPLSEVLFLQHSSSTHASTSAVFRWDELMSVEICPQLPAAISSMNGNKLRYKEAPVDDCAGSQQLSGSSSTKTTHHALPVQESTAGNREVHFAVSNVKENELPSSADRIIKRSAKENADETQYCENATGVKTSTANKKLKAKSGLRNEENASHNKQEVAHNNDQDYTDKRSGCKTININNYDNVSTVDLTYEDTDHASSRDSSAGKKGLLAHLSDQYDEEGDERPSFPQPKQSRNARSAEGATPSAKVKAGGGGSSNPTPARKSPGIYSTTRTTKGSATKYATPVANSRGLQKSVGSADSDQDEANRLSNVKQRSSRSGSSSASIKKPSFYPVEDGSSEDSSDADEGHDDVSVGNDD